jgi:sphinganine-1-phosphate aldolase
MLHENGWSKDQIFAKFTALREGDLPTQGGHAFAYIYDTGERAASELAAEAYRLFLPANGLDPTAFPSLLQLENEILGFAAQHLGGGAEAAGSFTSGGTESLILAVKTAREWARQHKPEVTEPELVLPVTAHAALHKAAHYLGVKLVTAAIDPRTFKADVAAMRAAINKNTIMLAASAASYAHGVIDPIAEIGALAQETGILLHVDACIGGFLLPYFKRLGARCRRSTCRCRGSRRSRWTCTSTATRRRARRSSSTATRRCDGTSCTRAPAGRATRSSTRRCRAPSRAGRWRRRGRCCTRSATRGTSSWRGDPRGDAQDHRGGAGDPRAARAGRAGDEPAVVRDRGGRAVGVRGGRRDEGRGWLVQPQLGGLGSPVNLHLTISAGHLAVADRFLADLRAAVEEARAQPGRIRGSRC